MTGLDSDNIIERMMEDHQQLMEYLQSGGDISLPGGDISLQSRVNDAFAKTLLLSTASYFESKMTANVIQVFHDATNGSLALVSFVRSKAVARRYHDWFAWDAHNANRFFSAFGEDFAGFMKAKLNTDSDMNEAIQAFMEIGRRRNALVHENYATFPLDKTATEVYDLYTRANKFVDSFPGYIREHIEIL